METLIKSPAINEHALDLLPQRGHEDKAAPRPIVNPPAAASSPSKPAAAPAAADVPVPPKAPAPAHETPTESAPAATAAAERQRQELLEAQQAALQAAEARAVEEGFAKGLAEGRQVGEKEYADAIRALVALVEKAQASFAGLIRESEDVIAAIVFEAVCKIVGQKLATPEGCAAVIEQVLAKTTRDEVVSVRISPDDYRRLTQHASGDAAAPGATRLAALPLEPDDRIELGGCILGLKGGSIDGRIETQFRSFAQSLKDAAKHR